MQQERQSPQPQSLVEDWTPTAMGAPTTFIDDGRFDPRDPPHTSIPAGSDGNDRADFAREGEVGGARNAGRFGRGVEENMSESNAKEDDETTASSLLDPIRPCGDLPKVAEVGHLDAEGVAAADSISTEAGGCDGDLNGYTA